MFLSIVIPIYNASEVIERCLDSIWSQGLPQDDYEVICVNDCSKDDSLEKLKALSLNHRQLRLIQNPENIRAGGARNHGVREACGEYIVFIDADDYFHHGSLKAAYEYQRKKNLDILMCDFARHPAEKTNDILVHRFPSQEIMSGRKFLIVNSLPFAPWKYIFKRSLMVDNNVWFTEKVSCEDVDWSHKIAFYATTMQYKPILLTHYILSPNTQTGSEFKNSATVFHRLMAGKRVAELLELFNNPDEQLRIKSVAESTFANGLTFLCGLISSPKEKATMIKNCIPVRNDWNRLISFATKYPLTFGIFSTIIAPCFRTAIYTKRRFLGR